MLNCFKKLQGNLSTLQAIPVIGPLAFSPIKAMVSKAQIITSIALGIFFKYEATLASLKNLSCTADNYENFAGEAFNFALDGGLNWIYAFANFATMGILGLCIELNKRKFTVIHY